MPIRCGKNGCLRETMVEGTPCKACSIGGRPLTDPKKRGAVKDVNVTNKPTIAPTGVTVYDDKGNPVDLAVLAQANFKACEFIFKTYWYGWENGCPAIFHEMFKDYGTFTVGGSSGNQDTISLSKNPQWNFQKVIFQEEKKSNGPTKAYTDLVERIKSSPKLTEPSLTGGVSLNDLATMVVNEGKSFTFVKGQMGIMQYEDATGIIRQIPTWAIT